MCIALGIPSVRELLARVTSSEVTELLAFYRLDPWDGSRRFDLPAAIVATTVANVNRGKDSKPLKPQDFMPDFDNQGRSDSDETFARMKALTALQMARATRDKPEESYVKIIAPEGRE